MFTDSFIEKFPPYFNRVDKNRLSDALKQFNGQNSNQISYENFYTQSNCKYLMQSDLLQPLQAAIWDQLNSQYETVYIPAMLLSNTCDLSENNERGLNTKNALFAPIIQLSKHIETLKTVGKTQVQIDGFINSLKKQEFSNLIFLPPFDLSKENLGYIVFLDKVFYRPTDSLNNIFENLSTKRIRSLSHFGFYLFLLKTINHLGRLPEELEARN